MSAKNCPFCGSAAEIREAPMINLDTDILLTMDAIAEKLGVSKNTIERWRRNYKGVYDPKTFPPPDTKVGGSPRWTLTTVNDWLNAGSKQ